MPTLTNAGVLDALGALRELAKERVPMAGALRMRQVIRALQARAEDIEEERKKLVEAHGRRREDGKLDMDMSQQVPFASDEDRLAYWAAYTELLALTWEHGYTVRVNDLGNEVKPALLVALGDLLEEGEGVT